MLESALLTFERVLIAVPYFAVLAALLVLGKMVFDRTTKYKFSSELTDRDNSAFGVMIAGFLFGLAIALGSTTYGSEFGVMDLVAMVVYGVLSICLMRLSILVDDKFVLHTFSIHDEIVRDKNVGTGFVVAGACIANGLVISGALTGESASPWMALVDVIIYWVIGQVMVVLGGMLFQKITSYDVHKIIREDDNAAAGLSFGGFLIGIGIITKAALNGATSNIVAEIPTIVIVISCGMALLVMMRIIVDRVFLPKVSLSKEIAVDSNMAAAAVAAAMFVSLSWSYAVTVTM